jgi:hypothetical protein
MKQVADNEDMTLLVIALIVVLAPLAVLYGADSRIDEHRR